MRARLPEALSRGPFTLTQARQAGFDEWRLRGASWRRISRGTYMLATLPETYMTHLEAARMRLPEEAVFTGVTAAWLHRIDVLPMTAIDATIPNGIGVSARAGIRLHRAFIDAVDVVIVRGMRATSMVRTIADVSRAIAITEAVVLADAALHLRRVSLEQLKAWADSHPGHATVKKLRRVTSLAEPRSESPMETRLRMILVLAGLPRPQAQVPIYDANGRFVGRPDLYYEKQRLGLEYDGGNHRSTMAVDNERQNRLLNAGVRLLRFTAVALQNADSVARQVRTELVR